MKRWDKTKIIQLGLVFSDTTPSCHVTTKLIAAVEVNTILSATRIAINEMN